MIFFNNINHGYKAGLLKKVLCGCFPFIRMWLLIAIIKRRAERWALELYCIFILFQPRSWIILGVRTRFLLRNFYTKRVIFEIAMMKIINNCIADSLNYFRLNESSSLYKQYFVYSIITWKNIYLKNYFKTFSCTCFNTL